VTISARPQNPRRIVTLLDRPEEAAIIRQIELREDRVVVYRERHPGGDAAGAEVLVRDDAGTDYEVVSDDSPGAVMWVRETFRPAVPTVAGTLTVECGPDSVRIFLD